MPRGPVRIIALALASIALFFFIFGSSASTTKTAASYSYVLTTTEKWKEGLQRYTSTEKWKLWNSNKDKTIAVTDQKLQTNRPGGDREQKVALKVAQAEEMARAGAAGHRLLPVDNEPGRGAADSTAASDDFLIATKGTSASTLKSIDKSDMSAEEAESKGDDLMRHVMQDEHADLLAASDAGAAPAVTSTKERAKTTEASDLLETTLITTTRTAKATQAASAPSTAQNDLSKALVIAKPDDKSAAWIKQEFSDWDATIFNISSTATKIAGSTVPRRGGPTLAFLNYLVDNYNELADTTLFISTLPMAETQRKNGWLAEELDYKAQLSELAPTLHTMNVSYVQATGYASLRCDPDPGCTPSTVIKPLANSLYTQPWHHEIPSAYRALFPSAAAVPSEISAPAGAQFAVSRSQIYKRERAEYAEMRVWVQETRMEEATLQRVMSALWHVVFSKKPVDCPEQEQCMCEFWGRCDANDDAAALASDGNTVDELKAKEA